MNEKYYYKLKKKPKAEIVDIFNRRADTFDVLPWVTNREFMGDIFKVFYYFVMTSFLWTKKDEWKFI